METRVDILIRGLWESNTEAIIDIRLGDIEYDIHKKDKMKMLLARWEKIKEVKEW